PRIGDRIELTSELIAEHATTVIRATTRGQGAVERVMSLVLLGDLVSLYLAVLRGTDPTPVRVIDDLKARLAER
ncbi:MAG TPA: SIS domain-containing protein, partial [Solirubrobacteraceae bacterium]